MLIHDSFACVTLLTIVQNELISFAFVKIKSKKSFFDFDKNDENKRVDDEKSSANKNNSSDDMNKNENETYLAKNAQKKEDAMTRINDETSTKFDSKND